MDKSGQNIDQKWTKSDLKRTKKGQKVCKMAQIGQNRTNLDQKRTKKGSKSTKKD